MFDRQSWFIREHVGLLKLADTYDILDPQTHAQLGVAKEEPSMFLQLLGLVMERGMLPTKICVYEGGDAKNLGALLFSIHRGFTFFRTRVEIRDAQGGLLGWLKSKLLTLGGAFSVFDAEGREVAGVKGEWIGWNFRLFDAKGVEIGIVTKKWAGLGKELFTTADNYIITLHEDPADQLAILLLAAGLAVDTVYKERK